LVAAAADLLDHRKQRRSPLSTRNGSKSAGTNTKCRERERERERGRERGREGKKGKER